EVVQLSIAVPSGDRNAAFGQMAIAPDGRTAAFIAEKAPGQSTLWVRPLDAAVARQLEGTEGAAYPFWSPDSRTVGFFAQGKVRKIAAAGGPPITLCAAEGGRGGAWSRDGVILFGGNGGEGLSRVPAEGGKPEIVTRLGPAEEAHRW